MKLIHFLPLGALLFTISIPVASKSEAFNCEQLGNLAASSPDCQNYVNTNKGTQGLHSYGWEKITTSNKGDELFVDASSIKTNPMESTVSMNTKTVYRFPNENDVKTFTDTIIADCKFQQLYSTNAAAFNSQGQNIISAQADEQFKDDIASGIDFQSAGRRLFQTLGEIPKSQQKIRNTPVVSGTLGESTYNFACRQIKR